jgi:hypothetical protein
MKMWMDKKELTVDTMDKQSKINYFSQIYALYPSKNNYVWGMLYGATETHFYSMTFTLNKLRLFNFL